MVNRSLAPALFDVQDAFNTMQIYLGSLYVNDFNKLGRTYDVIAQADRQFRSKPEDILRLESRNSSGKKRRPTVGA